MWGVSDWVITGDPLWSLNGTSDLAAELGRRTGLGAVPEVLPRRLGEIVRLPELIAAVGGFAAGLWWFRRRTLLPAAVAVLNGLAFLVFAVGDLPLLGRYLFLAAAMLCLFAAVGILGWTAADDRTSLATPHSPHPATFTVWRAAGIAALVGLLAFFVFSQTDRVGDLRSDIADRDRIQADLRDLVRTSEAENALDRCGRLFVPNHRPVPSLAYWTEREPEEIVSAQLERPSPDGLFISPANAEVEELSVLDPRDPRRLDAEVPRDYDEVARNRSWVLYAGC